MVEKDTSTEDVMTKEKLERIHKLSGDVVYLDGHIHNLKIALARREEERKKALAALREEFQKKEQTRP